MLMVNLRLSVKIRSVAISIVSVKPFTFKKFVVFLKCLISFVLLRNYGSISNCNGPTQNSFQNSIDGMHNYVRKREALGEF